MVKEFAKIKHDWADLPEELIALMLRLCSFSVIRDREEPIVAEVVEFLEWVSEDIDPNSDI